MSNSIQQQISKLQSQAAKAKKPKKEKENSARRRSRSRTPKGGKVSKTAAAHHRELKFKGMGGALDLARARAVLEPLRVANLVKLDHVNTTIEWGGCDAKGEPKYNTVVLKPKQKLEGDFWDPLKESYEVWEKRYGSRSDKKDLKEDYVPCPHKWYAGNDVRGPLCTLCSKYASEIWSVKDTSNTQTLFDTLVKDFAMARTAMRTALGTKPMRIDLWMEGSNTSSATSTQAPVQRCRPSDSAEFSSLAALFDEYTMTGAENVFKLYQSTGTAGGVDGGCAFDPVDPSAYGSLIGLLPAAQKLAPIATGASGSTAPQVVNSTGHFHFQAHCPKGPQIQVAPVASVCATGTWQDCTTTAADWGYFKYYVTAPPSGTSSLSWHIKMECLFRSRT